MTALRQEHDHADAAFAKARQDRTSENFDDDARTQLVKDRLAALKSKTDREANQQNDTVKDFNQEFSKMFGQRKKGWQSNRDEFTSSFKERTDSIDQEVKELLAAIEEEKRACLADTDAEIGRIRDTEKEHSDCFERLVENRRKEHAAFKMELSEAFGDLRRRVAREAQARESQARETRDQAGKAYSDLDEQIRGLSDMLNRDLEDIRERLREEDAERAHAQERVVDDMHKFIQSIQDNVADRKRGVGDTQNLLKDLRVMLHEG